jgi:hypothetical protein
VKNLELIRICCFLNQVYTVSSVALASFRSNENNSMIFLNELISPSASLNADIDVLLPAYSAQFLLAGRVGLPREMHISS